MNNITNAVPEGAPPKDFRSFDSEVIARHLLGASNERLLPGYLEWSDHRPWQPSDWPRNKSGMEYFHRGLARLLWERGGTAEAAGSIRDDLENGTIRAVVIDDHYGDRHLIEPQEWRAVAKAPEFYLSGRAEVLNNKSDILRYFPGDIYLVATSEPEASIAPVKDGNAQAPSDWWPMVSDTQKAWATKDAVAREAERRVKAAGVLVNETNKARAMEVMAGEAGRAWAASSIEATRRRAR